MKTDFAVVSIDPHGVLRIVKKAKSLSEAETLLDEAWNEGSSGEVFTIARVETSDVIKRKAN